MAEYLGCEAAFGMGSVPYMAPEALLQGKSYAVTPALDVWSVGVVLYVTLTGDFPWNAAMISSDAEYAAFVNKRHRNAHPWRSLAPGVLQLLEGMLAPEPVHRLSIAECRKMFTLLANTPWRVVPCIMRALSVDSAYERPMPTTVALSFALSSSLPAVSLLIKSTTAASATPLAPSAFSASDSASAAPSCLQESKTSLDDDSAFPNLHDLDEFAEEMALSRGSSAPLDFDYDHHTTTKHQNYHQYIHSPECMLHFTDDDDEDEFYLESPVARLGGDFAAGLV